MPLWDFQAELYQRVREAFRTHNSVFMQSPTGSGKTVIFTEMAKQAALKLLNVWVMVTRNELLEQASETFMGMGVAHGVIAPGGMESRAYNIHIVSKDTLIRRFDKIKRPPDFVIVDEAHLALDRYLEIHARYRAAKWLGVGATPARLDGRGLSELYEILVMGPTLAELIDINRLSPMRYFCPPIDGLDSVKRRGTEYLPDDLDRLLTARKVYGEAITHYKRHADHKPCLVYCRDIKSAEETAHRFNVAGYKFENIDGTMSYKQRRALIDGLRDGRIDGLTSCELITYGLDVPRVECVIMLRPTLSRTLYFQMVGRGLRIYPGKKELVVLDHVGNLQEHGHPLAPYEWQFDGKEKRGRRKKDPTIIARLCPEIDYLYCDKPSCAGCPHNKHGKRNCRVEVIEADLVEAESPVPMADRDPVEQDMIENHIRFAVAAFNGSAVIGKMDDGAIGELLSVAASTGRKPLWVYWMLSRDRATVNVPLLHEIARQKKFKPGWAYFTKKQIEGQMAGRK